MAYRIEDIEGIGPAYGAKLREAGIQTTADLLSACATRVGRRALAERCGIDEKRLLTWANMADLMRIRGIGPQYAELLEAAGVDTVKELRNRNAANLTAAMREVNEKRRLVRAVPFEKSVARWIEEARGLDPAITH